MKKIPGYITDSSYNAFGAIINRSYSNGLIQQFEYDEDNNRLKNIYIADVQNLTYDYDDAGNIISIIDTVNNRNHLLTYDNLNRLVEASIGSDNYKYSYSSLGNMMKIVENGVTKNFIYSGSQAHAPSRIVERQNGVDVYNAHDLDTQQKNRVVEFWLYHDTNESAATNLSVDFGDGNGFTNNSITVDESIWFLVENDYDNAGSYVVNITAGEDEQIFNLDFGLDTGGIAIDIVNATSRQVQLELSNDIDETISGINVDCSGATDVVSLAGLETKLVNLTLNYTSPGKKTVSCTASSSDGTVLVSKEFTVKGLEMEDYDVLITNISKRVVEFDIRNNFAESQVNLSMGYEEEQFSENMTVPSGESVMAFVEMEYDSPGPNEFLVNYSSGDQQVNYVESFALKGVEVENYTRTNTYSGYSLGFDLVNYWHPGLVDFIISDPYQENETYVDGRKTVLMQHNYDDGLRQPVINAMIEGYSSLLKDVFSVRALGLDSFTVLAESPESTVSELLVENREESSQDMTWRLDTGETNITGNLTLEDSVFIFIESNYTGAEKVHRTEASVNSTSHDDVKTREVVLQ